VLRVHLMLMRFMIIVAIGNAAVYAQGSADVSTNGAVAKAGEVIQFKVTLDHPTNLEDCVIQYTIKTPLMTTGAAVRIGPGDTTINISYKIAFDSPGGRYELVSLNFYSPSGRSIALPFKTVGYDVIPNAGVQYPSQVRVSITPSQVQLFRTEALALARRLQELKGNARVLQSKGQEAIKAELTKAVYRELDAIKQTNDAFRALSGDAKLLETGRVFFSDLSVSYVRVEANLRPNVRRIADQLPSVANGFFAPPQAPTGESVSYLEQEAVYRAAEQNELAYNLVANTGNLSFDLTLVSNPAGATIKYGRRGDVLKAHADPTKATLQSLPLAIWIIQFHKEGFQDQEREFNPFTENEHLVDVTLQRTRR
jgi:hypothetical protein